MKTIKDKELMVMFQQGSYAAFDILFERYRTPVFNFVYRMTGRQREAAEDLLQEIFMNVFTAAERFEPRPTFAAWLFAIARNRCLNHLQSRPVRQQKQTVPLDASAETGFTPVEPSAESDPGRTIDQDETRRLLEAAIDRLPAMYREVFLLHAVEGITHEEIARILDLNPATVRTHFHRARAMLRESLGRALDPQRS